MSASTIFISVFLMLIFIMITPIYVRALQKYRSLEPGETIQYLDHLHADQEDHYLSAKVFLANGKWCYYNANPEIDKNVEITISDIMCGEIRILNY